MNPDLTHQSKEGLWNALQIMTIELAKTYDILALALDEPTLGFPGDHRDGVVGLANRAAAYINLHKEQHGL